MTPHKVQYAITDAVRLQIGTHLSTRLTKYRTTSDPSEHIVARKDIMPFIPSTVEAFGKVKWGNNGDTMHASELVKRPDDGRDATYIRVRLLKLLLFNSL